MSAMAGRRLGLMTAKSYLQAGLTGGVPTPSAAGGIRTTISAFGGLSSALSGAGGLQAARWASYGGCPTISAAGGGLPTLSSASRVHAALSVAGGSLPSISATGSVLPALSAVAGVHPALSAAGGGLPSLLTAGSVFHTVGAARDLGGSGGPNFVSRSGSVIVFVIAGSVVFDLLDSFLKSGDDNAKKELEGDDTWEEKLAREEGKLLELMEGHLDQIKKDREDLSQRRKKFDDESAKKQANFDEERKVIDNGKRLLDDDRRKFHQERYEFDGGKKNGKKDKNDGKFDKFLKWLEYYLRIPGKLIDLKRTLEDFETVCQGFMVIFSAYGTLLFAGKFVEFFIAVFWACSKGPRFPC